MASHQVDVLLATYNGERYIEQQILSILSQTYQNFHLIIKDDCSTDQTTSIIKKLIQEHPKKITLYENQARIGCRANFSELMDSTKSDYVMFSDQDDYWFQDKIEKSLDKMLDYETRFGSKTPILIFTDLSVANEELKLINPSLWSYAKINPTCLSLNRLLVQNVINGCTMLINQSLLKLSKPIPECVEYHDWWIALVAAAFGHIHAIHESTIMHRRHVSNASDLQKNDLGSLIKKIFFVLIKRSIPKPLLKTPIQAKAFYHRFHDYLNPKQKTMMLNYSQIEEKFFLKRWYLFFRYSFFKNHWRHTFTMVFFSRIP